jgi:crotonobetainyl-CoA:carnitine CoA-transferase CaiB-like acyl-CoA transferase
MTGPPGRPLRAGASVNDIMGGMFGVIAILAALQERERSGSGQLVKSALFENNMFLVAQHMMQFAVTGKPAAPMPDRLSAWAVYDVFDTADGPQVFVGVVTDTQWRTFCDAFGLADLADDPALATNPQRVNARERFMPRLRAMFKEMSRAEILATCEKVGLPHAPIARPQDMFDDPHLNAPDAMVEVTLADGRKTNTPALPMELDGRRLGLRLDIPHAGEHSRQIASELGLSDEELDTLIAEGVLSVETAIKEPA